jgi:DNA-binding HxlR family transcriptional regulator
MKNGQHAKKIPCAKAMKIIGDYWTMSIVQAIGSHRRRFCELERLLPDSNPVTLTSRLKALESMGLLTRTKDPRDKISVTYALTANGRQLVPIAGRIQKFAEHFTD